MTQNVFGNNGRRKLDFKIGVVGEALNQVHVNGLPIKIELFNQEGCRKPFGGILQIRKPFSVISNIRIAFGGIWGGVEWCSRSQHVQEGLLSVVTKVR